MSGVTFEQLRIPAALILLLVAVFIFVPRGGNVPAAALATPGPTVIVGEPGGEVTSTTATAAPTTSAPSPSPSPTEAPTPAPVADTFAADVLACREISGDRCRGELETLPRRAASFTALVLFSAARAGDAINVILSGPGGTITGGPYTLQGGGDGYYYSTFSVGNLPGGDYTVVATRNGAEVARTSFRRAG